MSLLVNNQIQQQCNTDLQLNYIPVDICLHIWYMKNNTELH